MYQHSTNNNPSDMGMDLERDSSDIRQTDV